MKIGNKIKNKREKLDMSQEELGEKLNVSQSQVSRWEKNTSDPSSKEIKGLSKILGLSIEELLGKKGIKKSDFKWLKIVQLILVFILIIIFILTFYFINNSNKPVGKYTINCILDKKEYKYEIKYNKYGKIIRKNSKLFSNFDIKTDEAKYTVEYIDEYYKTNNGSCIIIDN